MPRPDSGSAGERDAEIAYAKVNLALHVRARRPDGYHDLETLFAFAENGDRLTVTSADHLSLTIDGPFADALNGDDPGDNLVLRAARALHSACGVKAGAALRLDKCLPVAAGIGGGSADAAAALRLLARFWGISADDARLAEIALGLGSDVPACLASTALRGEARGERLLQCDGQALAGLPLLLVNPRVPLSTAAVFAGWDGVDRGSLPSGEPLTAAGKGRNDLEASARALVPVIDEVLGRLGCTGPMLARMSGSGATCFALYADEGRRDRAAIAIGADRPNWWQLATRLR